MLSAGDKQLCRDFACGAACVHIGECAIAHSWWNVQCVRVHTCYMIQRCACFLFCASSVQSQSCRKCLIVGDWGLRGEVMHRLDLLALTLDIFQLSLWNSALMYIVTESGIVMMIWHKCLNSPKTNGGKRIKYESLVISRWISPPSLIISRWISSLSSGPTGHLLYRSLLACGQRVVSCFMAIIGAHPLIWKNP